MTLIICKKNNRKKRQNVDTSRRVIQKQVIIVYFKKRCDDGMWLGIYCILFLCCKLLIGIYFLKYNVVFKLSKTEKNADIFLLLLIL